MHRNHPKFSSKNKALLKRKGVTTEVRSLGLVGTAKTSCCSVDTSQRFQSKEKHNQASLCLNCPEKFLKTALPPLATADIWREGDETQLCSLSPTLDFNSSVQSWGKVSYLCFTKRFFSCLWDLTINRQHAWFAGTYQFQASLSCWLARSSFISALSC